MGKNSHIHIKIESELLQKLKKEAQENFISFSELCRRRLKIGDSNSEMIMLLKSIERKVYAKS